jgi:hypothetical protein
MTGHCGGVGSFRNEKGDVKSTALGKDDDDGGTRGLARTSSGNSLGRAALKREQRDQLLSNPAKSESRERKVRPITDVTSTALGKEERRYACRLFGMNSLKEGEMWHVDSLLVKTTK